MLAQFADDTSICLDGTEESFTECIKVVRYFSKISGLSMNTEKTNVIWIGCEKNSVTKFLRDENFCWNPGIFRILGISFCTNIDRVGDLNFDSKLDTKKESYKNGRKGNLPRLEKSLLLKH